MKDIEKIKSEDLAAQVQDANPANFAIEQEVAQLVGATVPAPTEPSADDARELGAQLLVFLQRALMPIQTALRTALAAIYAHLDSRCTDYTPAAYAPYQPLPSYDPMRPFVPRTLPNLLTALTAFSARKISNGSAPNDGIPDGVSLIHLICSQATTKLIDDNHGWLLNKAFPWSFFPNLTNVVFNCKKMTAWAAAPITLQQLDFPEMEQLAVNGTNIYYYNPNLTEIDVPELYEMDNGFTYDDPARACFISKCSNLTKVRIRHLRKYGEVDGVSFDNCGAYCCLIHSCENLEEVYLDDYTGYKNWRIIRNCPKVWRVVLGNITSGVPSLYSSTAYPFDSCVKLRDLEFAGVQVSLDLRSWAPDAETIAHQDFLQNFREHIALRLTANGSGKTLTLSQAVFDTIWNQDGTPKSTDPDSVIYQINKIIKTDKHWSVNRA